MANAPSVPGPSTPSADRIAALEARLAELDAVVARQGDELRTLRAAEPTPTDGSGAVSRRRLLLGGAAAAATAGAAVVAGAPPANANGQGGSWTLGDSTNTASAITGLTANLQNSPAMQVTNSSSIGSGLVVQAGSASGLNATGAIIGHSAGRDGVVGMSGTRFGVHGRQGTYEGGGALPTTAGVYGEGHTGVGVFAASDSNYALYATGGQTPIRGECTGAGVPGIYGTSPSAAGVRGGSDSGPGVSGESSSGPGLFGKSTQKSAAVLNSLHSQLRFESTGFREPPATDGVSHNPGEVVCDSFGTLWFNVLAGTPGTWRKVSGPGTAGALHVLAAPIRVYDSRPGTSPSTGPKTKLAANTSRTIDLASAAPAGATAALVTVLLVNTVAGNGNFTIWANGVAKPSANSMVWGGTTGRNSIMTLTALDATAKVQVNSSIATDVVLDVLGYYL